MLNTSFIKKHHLLLFFLTWFILNLVQAGATGLMHDEAYYWVYSKFPDWGYFDHPPVIAVLIRAGYFLFHNELGVRLLIVMLSTMTLAVIYQLLPRKNDGLFYAIACSVALLQIGSIIAVPDIPLTFFVALFFLAYKNFLAKMSLLNSFLLGLVMALMLYTKYHGILVILFTLLSNPKLALKFPAYIAAFIGAALFFPHLLWQYNHGFPSVQYHLFERNAPVYSVSFSVEYVLGQLVLPGPFMGWLLIAAAFSYKPGDAFERALKYSMVGIYAFFFISTLKGRVEANWTVPVLIPLLILSHQFLLQKDNWRNTLIRFVPVTLLLVLAVRIYMIADIMPLSFIAKDEVHKNKPWADSIYRKSSGLPVLFINSYQQASKYWFYSGVPAFSMNTPTYRRNNFNFWPMEDSMAGKKIAAVSPYDSTYYTTNINTPLGNTGMLLVDSFFSFSKVNIELPKTIEATNGQVHCAFKISCRDNHLMAFQTERLKSRAVEIDVVRNDSVKARISTNILLSHIRHREQTIYTSFTTNLRKGIYSVRGALPTSLIPDPSLNSSNIKLIVH